MFLESNITEQFLKDYMIFKVSQGSMKKKGKRIKKRKYKGLVIN